MIKFTVHISNSAVNIKKNTAQVSTYTAET